MSEEKLDNSKAKGDLDGDGIVSEKERNMVFEKIKEQGRMAWIAFFLICAGGVYTLGFAEESRITALGNGVMDWFYIILGSLILAYFGVTTFVSKK